MTDKGEKGDDGPTAAKRRALPRIFQSELRNMMYGFGDAQQPKTETVKLMEEIVIDYVTCLVSKSTEVAHQRRRERPEVEDIKMIIRKDSSKLNRVRYLLDMKQEIRRATAITNDAQVESAVNNM